MVEITGGQALAPCLAQEGVRFVFGLPCPEVDPFLAALEENEIRLVSVRHESAGLHMAEGLCETTGQVAAVLGNPGPGSANLLPGVITARHEGVRLISITSQFRPGIVYPSMPATFRGQDQLGVSAPAMKWGGPILPNEAQLGQAADLFAGAGVDWAEANEALLRLVDRLGCPVMTSLAGRSAVASDH